MTKPLMKVIFASPRGFCAGVERAVRMVEEALTLYGNPIYIRGDIVHNRYVVEELKRKGVLFISRIDEVPRGSVLLLSAHGSSLSVLDACEQRDLTVIDAICPLVLKVHKQVRAFMARGLYVVFIGHRHHPETRGVLGQNQQTNIPVLETVGDVDAMLPPPQSMNITYVTQTTLNPATIKPIVYAMKKRFRQRFARNHHHDICYATINRQEATRIIAKKASVVLVAGSQHSSNTQRLKEVAQQEKAQAFLIDTPQDLPWNAFTPNISVGITAGASAPESLVKAMTQTLAQRYTLKETTVTTVEERVHFPSPLMLKDGMTVAQF